MTRDPDRRTRAQQLAAEIKARADALRLWEQRKLGTAKGRERLRDELAALREELRRELDRERKP